MAEIDAERLITLVENRPAIYNYKLKEHSDKVVIDRLWSEIAGELKCSVDECKHKWSVLRNSYARALRGENAASKGRKRKPWYLKDSMSFLEDFMHHYKNTQNNLNTENLTEMEELGRSISSDNDLTTFPPPKKKSGKSSNYSPFSKKLRKTKFIEKITEPMIELLRKRSSIETELEDSNLLFLKSLLPDLNQMPSRKQRIFKRKVIELIEYLMDDDEQCNSTSNKPFVVNHQTSTFSQVVLPTEYDQISTECHESKTWEAPET